MKYAASLFALLLLVGAGRADDASDLAALQPLNDKELTMYQQVKDKPNDLHAFIATRTFFHALNAAKQKYCPTAPCDFSGPIAAELPHTTADVVYSYTIDLGEAAELAALLTAEQKARQSAPLPPWTASVDRAHDGANLKRLHPLTPAEQAAYKKVRNDPAKLHTFIVTRLVLRTMERIEKEQCPPQPGCSAYTDAMLAEIPPTDDVEYTYALDQREQWLLFTVLNYRKK
jgi:hypothetical protein